MRLGGGRVRVMRSRTAMNPVKQEFLPRSVGHARSLVLSDCINVSPDHASAAG